MNAPTRGSTTGKTQIEVVWNSLTLAAEIGGAPIISYILEWDAGTNNVAWTTLVGSTLNYLSTSFIVTTGVVPGTIYKFRVSARNAHGTGLASSSSDI